MKKLGWLHIYTEIKCEDELWRAYYRPLINKHYKLFEKMAENPKGLPDDISYIAKKEYEFNPSDYHHCNYLNLEEILDLVHWIKINFWGSKECLVLQELLFCPVLKNDFQDFYLSLKSYRGLIPFWVKDVRFVYWFDGGE